MILFKTRKRKQIVALGMEMIPDAVHAVEVMYPKGKSPGDGVKIEKALDIIKRNLPGVELLTDSDLNMLRFKIHDVHSKMSAYKSVQMDELKRQGIIREVPTLTVYRD